MTTNDIKKLIKALEKHFKDGTIDHEKVSPGGRYRIAIIAPSFKNVPHLKRQDKIWEVVDQTLPRDKAIDISLILAYAPGEIDQAA